MRSGKKWEIMGEKGNKVKTGDRRGNPADEAHWQNFSENRWKDVGVMSTRNILVVDDEPCIRDICVQFLGMAGYDVESRNSGEQALEALSQRSYDLAILDLRLQGMNGLTTFNHMKSIAPDVKAVVVSASLHEYEKELDDARRQGLFGVLAKPFNLTDLSALVESAFQSQACAA
jgi:DNA-binding NtrC family response regulator